MNEQRLRFRLGLFVLAALFLLAALVALFGGFPDLFQNYRRYTVTFPNAPGVAAGTPVRRSGIRVGRVASADLDNETGKVIVHLLVEPKYTLRKNDRAVLVHGLLGGDTSIDFVPPRQPGPEGAQASAPEDTNFEGTAHADVGTVVNQASGLIPPAEDTLKDLRRSLQRLERLAPLIEATLAEFRDVARATRGMIPEWQGVARATRDMLPEFQELAKEARKAIPELRRTGDEFKMAAMNWSKLGERLNVFFQTNETRLQKTIDQLNATLAGMAKVFTDENQRNLAATLKNVRVGSERLDSITSGADNFFKEGRQTLGRVNASVLRADALLTTMQQTMVPWPDRSRAILKNLEESTVTLNLFLGELRDFFRCVAAKDGTLQRFLGDPALYNHLDEAACALSRMMPRLDLMLRDLAVFADKLARHPESLGLGGVVRPSAGLKESPPSHPYGRTP